MDPTSELFSAEATMAELFGSDEEEAQDVKVKPETKKIPPPKRRPMKSHHVRSSVKSLLNRMRRRRKVVRKRLITFSDQVDTRWLANNRLKQQVRPVVASYTQAMKILEGKREVDRAALIKAMAGMMHVTVRLFRTQDKHRADLTTMGKEASQNKTQLSEFIGSVLAEAHHALLEVPPYLPELDEVLTTSFFQLRCCKRPTDPKKLFSRRNQVAAKTMTKAALASIPDATVQPRLSTEEIVA